MALSLAWAKNGGDGSLLRFVTCNRFSPRKIRVESGCTIVASIMRQIKVVVEDRGETMEEIERKRPPSMVALEAQWRCLELVCGCVCPRKRDDGVGGGTTVVSDEGMVAVTTAQSQGMMVVMVVQWCLLVVASE
ncbi:mucin-2 [Sesbania bispinosa]|nr:mucin-2 [Sesbania bispinosa]